MRRAGAGASTASAASSWAPPGTVASPASATSTWTLPVPVTGWANAVAKQVRSERFRGCAMMMTLAEFPDADLPGHRKAVAGKQWIRWRVGELTERLDVDEPGELADDLTLILEGMLASGQALGADGSAAHARPLAEAMLSIRIRR